MSTFRWIFGGVVLAFVLTGWSFSSNAALTQADQTFLANLSTQSMQLETPELGETRHNKRLQARMIKSLKKPSNTKADNLDNYCLYEGSCQRRFRRRGRRSRAWWFIARGWYTWGSAYGLSLIVGIAGISVGAGSGYLSPAAGAYFGMMLVPVIGPLVSFIIAMASVGASRDAGEVVAWTFGALGAVSVLIPQVVGFAFLLVGYISLSRLNRARYYGGDPSKNEPFWAVTPYMDPNGGGLAVFGRF